MRAGAAAVCVILALTSLSPVPLSAQQVPAADTTIAGIGGPSVSPRGAFVRSLVLPGWGQAYAGAPGRGAVYFALTGGSLFMSYVARRQLIDARDQEDWLRASGEIGSEEESGLAVARADQFEDWAALSIFLMFLSGADAYVSAYLSDFDERIGVLPNADGGLRLEAQIPVGGP